MDEKCFQHETLQAKLKSRKSWKIKNLQKLVIFNRIFGKIHPFLMHSAY
jgi:hypothetical protein